MHARSMPLDRLINQSGDVGRAVHDGALDLLDGVGDGDAARTGLGAVEDRAATPDAGAVAEDLEPLGAAAVAAVEDEAVRVDDGGWPHPLGVRPDGGTGTGAGAAEDALGRLVVALALLRRLPPLGARLRLVVDQIWLDLLVLGEEGVHIHDEIADDREA